jgi:hypothetical protein
MKQLHVAGPNICSIWDISNIPNILYFLITSVGNPAKPSAVATQPRHHQGYKVDMFFIIHTSNGRVSNFMLQVPISVPFAT